MLADTKEVLQQLDWHWELFRQKEELRAPFRSFRFLVDISCGREADVGLLNKTLSKA